MDKKLSTFQIGINIRSNICYWFGCYANAT